MNTVDNMHAYKNVTYKTERTELKIDGKSQYLNIMYANADSMTNKLDELKTYAEQYQADLILITESLAKNPTSFSEHVNNVYDIESFNCLECNVGRGVCLFYKNHLTVHTHDNINEMYKPSLFINIKTQNKPINVGLVYRSPSNDANDNKKMNNQLSFATKKLKNLVVFGDFNHPSIDWEYSFCNKSEEHIDSQFLFEIIKMNTNQLITSTTHHKPNCKPSLIDLILTKNPEAVTGITHNPPIGKSYHDCITAKLKMSCSKNSFKNNCSNKVIKPNSNKAKFNEINKYIDAVEWENSLHNINVNHSWDFIKTHISKAQELFVPNKVIRNVKSRINPVSKDTDLHNLLKNKRHLFKLYKTETAFYNYSVGSKK